MALDRDPIALSLDALALSLDAMALDRDPIALSPGAFKNGTLLRKTVLIKSGQIVFRLSDRTP